MQCKQSELQAKSREADELREELRFSREKHTTAIEELEKRTKELDGKLEEVSWQAEDARKATIQVCHMSLLQKSASLTQFLDRIDTSNEQEGEGERPIRT